MGGRTSAAAFNFWRYHKFHKFPTCSGKTVSCRFLVLHPPPRPSATVFVMIHLTYFDCSAHHSFIHSSPSTFPYQFAGLLWFRYLAECPPPNIVISPCLYADRRIPWAAIETESSSEGEEMLVLLFDEEILWISCHSKNNNVLFLNKNLFYLEIFPLNIQTFRTRLVELSNK